MSHFDFLHIYEICGVYIAIAFYFIVLIAFYAISKIFKELLQYINEDMEDKGLRIYHLILYMLLYPLAAPAYLLDFVFKFLITILKIIFVFLSKILNIKLHDNGA